MIMLNSYVIEVNLPHIFRKVPTGTVALPALGPIKVKPPILVKPRQSDQTLDLFGKLVPARLGPFHMFLEVKLFHFVLILLN